MLQVQMDIVLVGTVTAALLISMVMARETTSREARSLANGA